MKKIRTLLAVVCILVMYTGVHGCKKENLSGNDFLFVNGNIYTVNSAQPWAEAMLVEDGIITFVGPTADAEAQVTKDVHTIDLAGRMVLPGIHDVHMHPLEAGSDNFHFTVSGDETNAENYLPGIRSADRQNSGTGWLLGWGHYIHTILDASRSPKAILDDVSTERPIAVMELTSHSIWCNSKALELAGINAGTPDPEGGVIMRDGSGEAIGILIDNAGNLMVDLALRPTSQTEENDYYGLIEYSLPELKKYGITSVCDARTYWKRNHHLTWKRIADEGNLTARVNLGLWAYPDEDDATQIAQLKNLYENDPNSLLRINQVKLYSDGIIQNTTAAMHSDYHIDLFSRPTNNGVNYFAEARIADYISQLESTGFDFHIHAIGNRGVTESLNAIAAGGTSNGRHRLTHVEIVDPADYSRFASLNATADCQVAGDFTHPTHWHENDEFIDAALSNNVIPLKSLFEADARITLSSDWDVSTMNPFVGLQNAVTRSPQELSLEEAIKAYTINAAYVMRQEDVTGSLEVGKEADLIILNQHLFEIPAERIGQTKVDMTYLQGELIYRR